MGLTWIDKSTETWEKVENTQVHDTAAIIAAFLGRSKKATGSQAEDWVAARPLASRELTIRPVIVVARKSTNVFVSMVWIVRHDLILQPRASSLHSNVRFTCARDLFPD